MMTIGILLLFSGSFFLYITAKKEAVTNNTLAIENWIHNDKSISKKIGFLFLVLAVIPFVFVLGKTAGILCWLFLITILLSLLIVLYPLKKINYKHISILFIILFIVEFY